MGRKKSGGFDSSNTSNIGTTLRGYTSRFPSFCQLKRMYRTLDVLRPNHALQHVLSQLDRLFFYL